jgi:hypothetical protein
MYKLLYPLLLLAFSLSFMNCEKEEEDKYELSSTVKEELEDEEFIKESPEFFYDTLLPVKINFRDKEVQVCDMKYRAVYEKVSLSDEETEFDSYYSEGKKNSLTLNLRKIGKSAFAVNVYFKWERLKGDQWVPLEGVITHNKFYLRNYSDKIINSFVGKHFPADSAEVSKYTSPYIYFKYQIDQKVQFNDDIMVNPQLKSYGIKDESGNEIPVQKIWDDKKLTLKPEGPLKANSKYTAYVINDFSLTRGSDSKAKGLKELGFEFIEQNEWTFWTKDETNGDMIDDDNVEYSYPIVNQYNFLPQEYNKGFLKLKFDQQEITGDPNTSDVNYKARFIDILNSDTLEFPVDFNFNERYFSYNLSDELKNSTIYKVEILKNTESLSDIIYQYHFRTSSYDTFNEKTNNIFIASGGYVYNKEIGCYVTGDEFFDKYECEYLIRFKLDLENIDWFNNKELDHFYEGMQETNYRLENRNVEKYGAPPVRAMEITNWGVHLTEKDIENQTADWDDYNDYYTEGNFYSNLINIVKSDIKDIKNQISEDTNVELEWCDFVGGLSTNLNYPNKLNYTMKYVIPGGIKTSEKELYFSLE